jgi:multidrug efflux pump subunit AcrB
VVIENIYRLRSRGMTAPRASVQGARQVEGAIIASTLTTICVFMPLVFTSGMSRQLMLPFALTIGFSLVASLVVALTVVPTIASVLLRRTKEIKHPIFDAIVNAYGKALELCLKVKLVPLAIAIALLAVSVAGVMRMGTVMIPDMASDQLSVTVQIDEDAELSREECFALVDEINDRLLKVDGVKNIGSLGNTGSLMSGMAMDNFDRYNIYILPDADIDQEQEVFDLVKALEKSVADVKNAEVSVSASAMGSMSTMLGSGLTVNIYGSDLEELTRISHDFESIISDVEGFEDVTNGQEKADETLHLIIDRDKAMKLGLTNAQIFSQLSSELTTETNSIMMTIDDMETQVVIVDETKLPTKEKLLKEVFETTVTNDDGEQETEEHKLKEFATVETEEGYLTINRENNQRLITVTATTKEGYNTTLLAKKIKPMLDAYEMPDGYHYQLSGEYENVRDMINQMLQMISLGFLFIYLVMVAQFQSLLSPFIVIFTVPLAFTGGFLGLLAGGEQLSLFSMMGFAVLMGTVVNNGIVFVDYTNQLRLGGMGKRPALIATGKTRMRPILMTAMTTILAMSAMVFDRSTSAGVSRGMAIVVAGGLLYATLMTLFIVPVMYELLYRRQPRVIDVGSDEELDAVPDDAEEFLREQRQE